LHLHQLYLLLDTHPELVHAVLSGRIAIRDALDIYAGTLDLDDVILGSRYDECHRRLVAECERLDCNKPPITERVPDIEALEAEIARMPLVSALFVRGELTLVQARYAHRMGLSGEPLDKFVARARKKRQAIRSVPLTAASTSRIHEDPSTARERALVLARVPADMRDGFRDTPIEHIELYLSVREGHQKPLAHVEA